MQKGFWLSKHDYKLWLIEEGESLPGDVRGLGSDHYWRVPAPLVFAIAPFSGALFVLLLPFLGFAVLLTHIFDRDAVWSTCGLAKEVVH